MRVEGSYTVPGTPERVYALLLDPVVLADCMPGCQQLAATGENTYEMKMKVVLAALSGDFTGKIAITNAEPPTSYRLSVDGTGRIGFLKGHGDLQLAAVEGGTLVSYEGDVSAGGTLAAVGQRLMDTTARMMIRRFFERLVSQHAV
ncbi:MAG: carbon monoxide dehydrogenase subunit G [Bryobacterales bacterium]|nr:carbon monoxide dehydrogenase subunit G [Bryobacterales bacterium]